MDETAAANRMNRRDFLKVNIKSLVKTAAVFVQEQMHEERVYIRPPGALPEQAFFVSCSRCGACKDACTEGIISLLDVSAGKQAGTPVLDLQRSSCTMCLKCVDACPDKALEVREGQTIRIGGAHIIRNNCLAERDTICDYCIRACPIPGAMSLAADRPQVDLGLCTGCGQCAANCIAEYPAIFIEPI